MPLARSVGPGHPDALLDRVAITLVEAYLARDAEARLRVSVTGGRESIFVDGDVVSEVDIDVTLETKRVIAEIDPGLTADVFFACEPVSADVLPAWASFDAVTVCGYATTDTTSGWPLARQMAYSATQALEAQRKSNPELYGLGPDYEVLVDDVKRLVLLRLDAVSAFQQKTAEPLIMKLFAEHEIFADWTVRVLSSAGEASRGLRRRSGRSGNTSSLQTYSSHLPANASGVGYVWAHPLNLGAWLLRAEAHRLAKAGHGRGVLLHALWLPGETRPHLLSARNERGDVLLQHLEAETFDLAKAHTRLAGQGWLQRVWQEPYDASLVMPWDTL